MSDRRLPVRSLSLLLLALLVPRPAAAVEPTRVDDPDAGLRVRIDQVLDRHLVGGESLRGALQSLALGGCLTAVGPELTAGLDALRVVHVAAVERKNYSRAWSLWERELEGLSSDAFQLVTTWLDSPETARRLYLCEDDLPRSWRGVDAPAYVREALGWFDAAAAERDRRLRRGAPADREQAVMELMELRSGLVRRFIATYPEGEPIHDDLLVELEERLDLMWEVLVEPFHLGFTPKARSTDRDGAIQNMGRARVQTPFTGIAIPDPRDVAARDRVVRSWRRQRRRIDTEITDLEAALTAMVTDIETRAAAGEPDADLDRMVREAARLDARLASTVATLERMQHKVRHYSTGRSWIDGMLSNGYRRRAVKRLSAREAVVQEERREVNIAIARAVQAGAMPPGELREGALAGLTGRRLGGRAEIGPGNWLVGLPESTNAAVPTEPAGIPAGSGWVARTYEGPMPTPSGWWSDDLVDAVRARHRDLDDADVRILLGLVRLAYSELDGRVAVEEAVARSLATGGLSLLGEEGTLSDLWIRGQSSAEQPIVTFVLKLFF